MKRLHLVLIALTGFLVFAPIAVAKPPFWDDQINSPGRFTVLREFGNAAVFDKETGLVWEQSPAAFPTQYSWAAARSQCSNLLIGGRKGWRLPAVHELASVVDNVSFTPSLPSGHPFGDVVGNAYWSATTDAADTSRAWYVSFVNGNVFNFPKGNFFHVWCVRGGMNSDAY